MNRLSACLITYNEEHNLPRALTSLAGIADEIVVVDSGSTDRTAEIARAHGVSFFERSFTNHADQKNYAAWCASNRSEEHTSELQSQSNLVCRLLLEKKK